MRLFLRATAHFPDGSSQDVTYTGRWVSSNPSAATVGSADGTVVGLADGQTDVTVTYKGVSAVAQVSVGSILVAIEIVVPEQLGIGIQATFRFSALGQFTDGARDVTQTVSWTSSDPLIASVSNEAGDQGLTTGLAPGLVTVTARSGSVLKAVSLTVLPIRTLAKSEDDSTLLQFGGLGVDSSGQALAMWNYRFAPAGTADLFYSKQSSATAWTQAAPIRTVTQVELSSPPKLAMNASGVAVAAWHQVDGLYAVAYSPTTGWNSPVKVVPMGADEPDLHLGIDGAGNALITWNGDTGLTSSAMDATTGAWSVPTVVPGSNPPMCILQQARLAMGASGRAVLAWTRNCVTAGVPPGFTYELLASTWTAGGGWLPTVSMVVSERLMELAVASNDAGDAQVAWIVSEDSAVPSPQGPLVGSVSSRRFSASSGWGANQTIATGLTRLPANPMVAINVHGSAVLAWRNGFDLSISTALSDSNSVWTQPVDLYRPSVAQAGDPTVLPPSMTDDGRVLVPWIVSDLGLLGQVATARYVPGTGWEQGQTLTYTGRRGLVMSVDIRFNRQGRGAILWLEGAAAGFNLYESSLSF